MALRREATFKTGDSIYAGRWSLPFSIARLRDRAPNGSMQYVLDEIGRAHPSWTPEWPGVEESSFLFGSRGRSVLAATDPPVATLGPPTEMRSPGDLYDSDVLLLFHAFETGSVVGEEAEGDAILNDWATFLASQLEWLEERWSQRVPLPLGFGHGAAGMLFAAWWFARVHGWRTIPEDRVVRLTHAFRSEGRSVARHMAWPTYLGDTAIDRDVLGWFCNGPSGSGAMFAEAFASTGDEAFLDLSLRALRAAMTTDDHGPGFCCGDAGKAALVSRLLRLGVPKRRLGRSLYSHERARQNLLPWKRIDGVELGISGLSSALGVSLAEAPEDPVLDYYLPSLSPRRP